MVQGGINHLKPFFRSHRLLLLISASVLGVLARVLLNDLVWDDTFLISDRDNLGEWSTLKEQLTAPFWQNSSYVAVSHTNFWRPFTSALLWLGGALFGEWAPGFHFLSLLGCAGAGASLIALLTRLLPEGSNKAPAYWLGLIFLAHPLCAEVLSMVANVSDHLVLLFLGLELVLLIDLMRGRRRRLALPLIALYAFLAACSKEVGVLGGVAPLAAWLLSTSSSPSETPPARTALLSWRTWAAAAGPIVAYLVLRQLVISSATDTQTLAPASGLDTSWMVFFMGFGQSLSMAAVPIPSGFHLFLSTDEAPVAAYVWSLVAALGLISVLVNAVFRKRRPTVSAMGIVFALALLAPALLTVIATAPYWVFPVRYFHLPLAGLLVALLPLVARYWARFTRYAVPAAVCLLLLLSFIRIDEWKSDISLFHAEARYNSHSAQTLLNLSFALCSRNAYNEAEEVLLLVEDLGDGEVPDIAFSGFSNVRAKIAAHRDRDYDRASGYLEKALKRDPTSLVNVFSLANIRNRAGHPEQSVIILDRAMKAPWFQDVRREKLLERLQYFKQQAAHGDNAGATGEPAPP